MSRSDKDKEQLLTDSKDATSEDQSPENMKTSSWSLARKLALITLIIAVFLSGITSVLIAQHNRQKSSATALTKEAATQIILASEDTTSTVAKKEEPLKILTFPNESAFQIKSLSEMYADNNIDISQKSETLFTEYAGNQKYPTKVTYDQISGLRNRTVEAKINQTICDTALKLGKALKSENGAAPDDIDFRIVANYGDVISCSGTEWDYGNFTYSKNQVLNLRLDTGNQIKFSDLFIAGTNLNQIIADCYGSTLTDTKSTGNFNAAGKQIDPEFPDGIQEPLSDDDEDLLKVIQAFKANPDIPFTFDRSSIYTTVAGGNIEIEMPTYYQSIAIYKRFKSRVNLYTKGPGPLANFVFCSPAQEFGMTTYRSEKISDNLLVNTLIIPQTDSDSSAKLKQQARKFADGKIAEAKVWAARHPNQALILGIRYTVGTFDPSIIMDNYQDDEVGISVEEDTSTMPKSHFEEVLLMLAKGSRAPTEGESEGIPLSPPYDLLDGSDSSPDSSPESKPPNWLTITSTSYNYRYNQKGALVRETARKPEH
ncbi:MAG: hypothetical protein FWF45_02305 [Coriobacteriia bacterium]|nr:hypothetical protein [Coriobacteriia bacterium]